MLRFSEEDVIKLAKGVVEDPIEYCYDKNGSDYHYCKFCLSISRKKERLQHDLDCIVLIAQDILTGVDK